MGVLGLWQLIGPAGQPVPLETLENKILAVDISIWLNQAVKGYRDSQGGPVVNAHLLSLFSRLCKLLFYKVRPIIVFDGGVPELKKQTVINRQRMRATLKKRSKEELAMKLLTNYVAHKKFKTSDKNKNSFLATKFSANDDIYALPPLEKKVESQFNEELGTKSIFGDEFLSSEQLKFLDNVDIESEDFANLPPDIKQEILVIMKEKRKRRNREYYETLPKESDDFSSYQMKSLLKRRVLQNKIEEVQRGIQKSHCLDIISLYSNDQMVGEPSKIMSDESSHYILLKKIHQEGKDKEQTKPALLDVDDPFFIESDASTDAIFKLQSAKQDLSVKFDTSVNSDVIDESESSEDDQDAADVPNTVSSHNEDCTKLENVVSPESVSPSLQKNKVHEAVEIPIARKVVDKKDKTPEKVSNESIEEIHISDDSDTDSESFTPVPDINSPLEPNRNFLETLGYKPYDVEVDSLESNTSVPIDEDITIENTTDQQAKFIFVQENDAVPSSSFSENHCSLEDELSGIQLAIQKELEEASILLNAQQAKHERQASTIQEHMVEECKHLLRLFGVPFVVGPMEAEAQCAFFDLHEMTHGTITDDSDIWLFGGKRVYKNFFAQKKYVEFFKDQEIQRHFGLSRIKLINFAMLTGSDYSEGINGVGPVTAMEIISEFGDEGINALFEFRKWWNEAKTHATPPKNKVRSKLQRLPLLDSFPDKLVFDAYLNPTVDNSLESFSWGIPDLGILRDYAKEKFGWDKSKVDDALLPVIKKLTEKTSQTHLDSFFTVHLKKVENLFPSKRVLSALDKINPKERDQCDDPKPKVVKKTRVSKSKALNKNKLKNVASRVTTKRSTKAVAKSNITKSFLSEESSSDDN